MHQTTHFFNLGYGWLCKHCSAEDAERKHHHHPNQDRQATPTLPALGKWVDEGFRCGYKCPRCGIEEFVKKPS
jgi:hypothetical protein